MMLSVLPIAIIHFANACTLHTYVSLINKETTPFFGPETCSARDEEVHSRWLMGIYLTTPFTLSCIQDARHWERGR